MELNKYNMYSYSQGAYVSALDEVDMMKQELMRMTEYDDVKNFITRKFGEIDGSKWLNYPELSKHIYLYVDNNKVEFCTLKNKQQYWGRGWQLEQVNENNEE